MKEWLLKIETWYTPETHPDQKTRQALLTVERYLLKPCLVVIRKLLENIKNDINTNLFADPEYFSALKFYLELRNKKIPVPSLFDFLYTYGGEDGQRIAHEEAYANWHLLLKTVLLEPYVEAQSKNYIAQERVRVEWLDEQGNIQKGLLKNGLLKIDNQLLKDGQFNASKKDLHGRGLALPIRGKQGELLAYAKAYPEYPFIHLTVQDLAFRLSGFGQVGTLCKFTPLAYPDAAYPVFLSPYAGPTLLQSLEAGNLINVESQLDLYAFTLKAFESYMMVYGDDKLDNLSIQPLADGGLCLISIDPDRALGSEWQGKKLGLKTAVYCCKGFMEEAAHPRAVAEFRHLVSFKVLSTWLEQCLRWADALNSKDLFSDIQRQTWKKEKKCAIEVSFETGMSAHLYQRWRRLVDVLKEPDEKTDSDKKTLFNVFERLMPMLMSLYKESYEKNNRLDVRFCKLPTDYQKVEAGRVFLMSSRPQVFDISQTPAIIRRREGTDETFEFMINRDHGAQFEPAPKGISVEFIEALFAQQKPWVFLAWNHDFMRYFLKIRHIKTSAKDGNSVYSVTSGAANARKSDTMLTHTPSLAPTLQGIRTQGVDARRSLNELKQVDKFYVERDEHVERVLKDDLSKMPELKQWPFLLEGLLGNLNWDLYRPDVVEPAQRIEMISQAQKALFVSIKGVPLLNLSLKSYLQSAEVELKKLLEASPELTSLRVQGSNLAVRDFGDETLKQLFEQMPHLKRLSPRNLPELRVIEGEWDRMKQLSIGGDFIPNQVYFQQKNGWFPLFQIATEQVRLERVDERPAPLVFSNVMNRALKSNPADVRRFLRLVAEGEQGQAEEMLKKNHMLIYCAGDVTDLSGRKFEGITGFQYAVWALDWHMWKMLLNYLPPEAALEQIEQADTGLWTRKYGKDATLYLEGLINALDIYGRNALGWNFEQCTSHWCQQVGGAQLLLPVHVINEYCRNDRSFISAYRPDGSLVRLLQYGSPKFDEEYLPRGRSLGHGQEWFTGTYNGDKLGKGFGVCRGGMEYIPERVPGPCVINDSVVFGPPIVECDFKACSALLIKRTDQRNELLAKLSQHTRKPLR